MMLLCVGVNHRTTSMDLREGLAITPQQQPHTLVQLAERYGCEAVILSTCNRVEFYLGRLEPAVALDAELIAEFLSEVRRISPNRLRPCLYSHVDGAAVTHLFRVVGGLDSLVLGESQIAGQVKRAYEIAQTAGTVGPLLHALFQQARLVGKRIRSETGIAQGKVSIPSLAMDYVAQVFAHFNDKTVLVIGAGKMGELTLKHLASLRPKVIEVANRSAEKAAHVASNCGGRTVPWERLDDAMVRADIILSTTGAAEPVISLERFSRLVSQRNGRRLVILDIAVPRDFDPRIGSLDLVDLLVNVDDLQQVRAQVVEERQKHVAAAEALVAAEQQRFLLSWSRRRFGSTISQLSRDWDAIRQQVEMECLSRLNGKLSEEDKQVVAGALRLLQNRLMHAPLAALRDEAQDEAGSRLVEAIQKLFRLRDRPT